MLPHNSHTYNELLANTQSHVMKLVVRDFKELLVKITETLVLEDNDAQKSILQGKARVLAELISDYTKQPRGDSKPTDTF